MMENIYQIGDKTIDLNKLVAIGELYDVDEGDTRLPIHFNYNISLEVRFMFYKFIPDICQIDLTPDEIQAEVDKLKDAWRELTRLT
jgi:hypothetical protein